MIYKLHPCPVTLTTVLAGWLGWWAPWLLSHCFAVAARRIVQFASLTFADDVAYYDRLSVLGLFSLSIGVPACRNLGIAPLRKRKNNGGTDDEDERNTRRETHCELLVVLLQRQTELSEGSYESPVGLYTIRRPDAHSLVTGGKVATEA